jgi:hypothetical protein
MRILTSALALCLTFVANLSAEINGGYTPQWLSHKSLIVCVATPLSIKEIKGPGEVFFTLVRFRADRTIKGHLIEGDIFSLFDYAYNESDKMNFAEAVTEKRPVIVYAAVAKNHFKATNGKLIFTVHHSQRSAYYVDDPVTNLFTTDFLRVTDTKQLIKLTETQVAKERDLRSGYWRGSIKERRLNVPWRTEAHGKLFAGSSCYLLSLGYEQPQVQE